MGKLTQEIHDLLQQLLFCKRFSFSQVSGDDKLVCFYTGLPSAEAFDALFESIYHYIEGGLVWHHSYERSLEEAEC